MKYLVTDKNLKALKDLQEILEDGLVSEKHAALSLKYAIEDIEAMALDVKCESPMITPEGASETLRVIVAAYEVGGLC